MTVWNKGKTGVYSEESIEKMRRASKHRGTPAYGFKKGNIPWNKGTKGLCKATSGGFKKGHKPVAGFKKGCISLMKGKHHSKETREELRRIGKGRLPNNGSFKNGLIPWNKGKKYSNPSMIGRRHSEDSKLKMSRSHMGHPPPKSAFKKGNITWCTGKTGVFSEDVLKRMRIKALHRVCPAKNTKIEVAIQKGLRTLGIPFRKHEPIIGQPDIFIEPNLCIFADGDYWHSLEYAKKHDKIVNNWLISQGYRRLKVLRT